MIDAIKKLLNNNSSISVPFKNKIDDWYSEINISRLGEKYVISQGQMIFYNIDEAIDYFCDLAYSSKNKALIQTRLFDKGLIDEDFLIDSNKMRLVDEECELVDEKFKKRFNKVKEFPDEITATNEIAAVVDFEDINKLRIFLENFERKYSMFDVFLSLTTEFTYIDDNDNEQTFSSGFGLDLLTEEHIKEHKENEKLVFSHVNLTFDFLGHNNFKRFKLKI